MRIRNALVSVSDKTGLTELAAALKAVEVEIYSTGGSAAALRAAGVAVRDVAELTGFSDLLDGRVKTLHPHLHAAILADMENSAHRAVLAERGLPKLDLVVVNFYPFEKTVAAGGNAAAIIENIDIGGPTMVRAAAKNHASTVVLTDPADYPVFIGDLKKDGGVIAPARRRYWAMKAFIEVAHLDVGIANYFAGGGSDDPFPPHRFLHLEKVIDLSYGENPHQRAAFYGVAGKADGFVQLQGPPVSYNNLLDARAACFAVSMFDAAAAAAIKHNNPCGIAVAQTPKQALRRAVRTDAISAYGGVVAFNRPLDEETALLLQESFWEVAIAPSFTAEAKRVLALKEKPRLLHSSVAGQQGEAVSGHDNLFLIQEADTLVDGGKVVSRRAPDDAERRDLNFAWRAAAAVKSNAVVIAKDEATVGIGAGQMSRVDSAWLACEKAKRARLRTKNTVAASDGFFPFPDGLETLAKAGVTAVIQPGGSKKDEEMVAVADQFQMAMIFTGRRHFRH